MIVIACNSLPVTAMVMLTATTTATTITKISLSTFPLMLFAWMKIKIDEWGLAYLKRLKITFLKPCRTSLTASQDRTGIHGHSLIPPVWGIYLSVKMVFINFHFFLKWANVIYLIFRNLVPESELRPNMRHLDSPATASRHPSVGCHPWVSQALPAADLFSKKSISVFLWEAIVKKIYKNRPRPMRWKWGIPLFPWVALEVLMAGL